MSDGTRRITHVTELTGLSEEMVSMQDIFVFEKKGVGPTGKVLGRFTATGVRPKFMERLAASGIHLPPNTFDVATDV